MTEKSRHIRRSFSAIVIVIAVASLMTGCWSFGGAVSSLLVKPSANAQPAPTTPAAAPAPAAPPPATASPAPQPAQSQQAQAGSTPSASYQYQFGAFYSGMWGMGWLGYGDANYSPGQGTVWAFSNSGNSSNSVTFERALLKINADASQWWRFKMDMNKRSIVYEFLVGADSIVKKVRYQDPDNGAIGEFVPDQTQQQQPTQAQYGRAPKSRAEMADYLVGKQNVQVKAGSFIADHYLISDTNGAGTAEMWLSDKVPGLMVKAMFTSKKDGKTATEELVQIESGVATALSSY